MSEDLQVISDRKRTSIISTSLLAQRESRSPDYKAENEILANIVQGLGKGTEDILQQLTDAALSLCKAGSSGITILESGDSGPIFRWHAVSGAFANRRYQTMPRAFSPCGIVLDTSKTQLLTNISSYFTYLSEIQPQVSEVLLVPFFENKQPIGTVWVVSHDAKKFDREDVRVLESLAQFVSAALEANKHRSAQAALRSSEEFNRRIVESSGDCIQVIDLDGTLVSINERGARLLEIADAQSLVGSPWMNLWPVDSQSEVTQALSKAREGKSSSFEGYCHTATGRPCWLHVVANPIFSEKGIPERILVISRDITKYKQVAERDSLLVRLGDATLPLTNPSEIMKVSTELLGRYLEVNRCAYADVEDDQDTFNLSGDYNFEVKSIVGRYRFAQFGSEVLRLMRAGKTYVVDDSETDPRTQEPAILESYRATSIRAVICVPLRKSGKFVAAMAVHQATPRKWYASEIELVNLFVSRCWESIERVRVGRELVENEKQFRQLADAMPQIVWAAQPDGKLDYYNKRWFEYIDKSEGAAEDTDWARYVHPKDLERVGKEWAASIETGNPYETEFRVANARGIFHWFLVRALPIRNASGGIERWYGTCTHIDEQKQLQEENLQLLNSERAARSEAEKVSRLKDDFLATISHELRTPLNAILGWAQMLKRGSLTPDKRQHGIDVIERNTRVQAQLIDDLLDMSRIISGKVRLSVEEVDLVEIISAAVESVRPAMEGKEIELQVDISAEHGEVTADRNRVQQMIWNLLSNAIKFTPRKGLVKIGLRKEGDNVEISVIDSGQGISAEFLPHVFERFRQADASTTRNHGGMGLGLSIVKQLVELHGGEVQAFSPGLKKGSTFKIFLPERKKVAGYGSVSDGIKNTRFAAGPIDVQAESLAGLTVLVVDDEVDAGDLLRNLLEECGAMVKTATSVERAVELLSTTRFDIVVSDIGMPEHDGFELIRTIRSRSSSETLPAIALTALAREEDRARILSAGFQAHLPKPVNPAVLIRLLNDFSLRRATAQP